MKIKFDRIISIATLVASLVAIVLVLKKPAPVAAPSGPAAIAEQAQPIQQPVADPRQTDRPWSSSSVTTTTAPSPATTTPRSSAPWSAVSPAKPDARINSEEVSSAVAKLLSGGSAGAASLSPDSYVGSGDPIIKDQQVTMEGDIIHGRFLTEIAGKDVWVTISGHMGEKDGYATFDPTEFKVGDMDVPVSLVNPALQRKLAEERDRLKIPGN